MKQATWINGKKRVRGLWEYRWASDSFLIVLDSKDSVTGRQRSMVVKGDSPEWGNWKRESK